MTGEQAAIKRAQKGSAWEHYRHTQLSTIPERCLQCPVCRSTGSETFRTQGRNSDGLVVHLFTERTWKCGTVLTADGTVHITRRCDDIATGKPTKPTCTSPRIGTLTGRCVNCGQLKELHP